VLASQQRMRRAADFRVALRGGLTVSASLAASDPGSPDVLVGFVVSRAVGGAVVRNRVKRQLRHAVRPHIGALPAGALLVLRGLPAAAAADPGRLDADVSLAIKRLLAPARSGGRRR